MGPTAMPSFPATRNLRARTDDEFTAFYLTDYLARHFDKLIWAGLGLDRHPELLPSYFGNYTKVIYLAQTYDEQLVENGRKAAEQLGLAYEYRFTGYGELEFDMAARSTPLA